MPLLMCKDNFVIEPSLWLEYASNEVNPTFDTFVERKLTQALSYDALFFGHRGSFC